MVETLNEIAHLRNSKFGRPRPRHGLKLLYWFANKCITFDNNNEMHCKCNPTVGHFGFRSFENRLNRGAKLLPHVNIPYYEVGNLKSPGADQLPRYVSEDRSENRIDSNTDRIIISVDDDEWIENVYVTKHIDKSNFDPDATFRISRGLLMIIRNMDRQDFLWETSNTAVVSPPVQQDADNTGDTTSQTKRKPNTQTEERGGWNLGDWCVIL